MPGWNEAAWFSFLTGVALKSIAVLGAAWLVTLFLRGRSAAARHLVWMAAFGGLLALPLLTVAVPALPVPGTGAILAPQIVFHTDASAGVQIGGPLDFQAKAGQGAARRPGGLPHLDWRAALMLAWAVAPARCCCRCWQAWRICSDCASGRARCRTIFRRSPPNSASGTPWTRLRPRRGVCQCPSGCCAPRYSCPPIRPHGARSADA